MKTQRGFRPEFKGQVVEEILGGISSPGQIIRRYENSSGLLYPWKRQCAEEAFKNRHNKTAIFEERVCQMEQIMGELALENEFFKKAVQRSLEPVKKSGKSLAGTGTSSKVYKGGSNS